MPTGAPHSCGQPGCPARVPAGKARCPDHERKRDQERGTSTARGYDSRWRAYRLTYLRSHPLCVVCSAVGTIEPATVVDHISAHKGDRSRFWDENNHRAVCKRCHDLRTDEGDFQQ